MRSCSPRLRSRREPSGAAGRAALGCHAHVIFRSYGNQLLAQPDWLSGSHEQSAHVRRSSFRSHSAYAALKHDKRKRSDEAPRLTDRGTAPRSRSQVSCTPEAWDSATCDDLIGPAAEVRRKMLPREATRTPRSKRSGPIASPALAPRPLPCAAQRRLRPLQEGPPARAVFARALRVDAMASVDGCLASSPARGPAVDSAFARRAAGIRSGACCSNVIRALFGPAPPSRPYGHGHAAERVPPTSARPETDRRGMDITRINCAHDGPEAWARWPHWFGARRGAPAAGARPDGPRGPQLRTADLPPGPSF